MILELHAFTLSPTERSVSTVWHSHALCQIGCVTRGQVIVWLGQDKHTFFPDDFYFRVQLGSMP